MSVELIDSTIWRMAGCGDACIPRRHDPIDHERYGRQKALSEMQRRVVASGDIRIDLDRWETRVRGAVVEMGPKMRELMVLLAQNIGRVVTYDRLCREILGGRQNARRLKTLRMIAFRLRQRLDTAGCRVLAVSGCGMMLEPDE